MENDFFSSKAPWCDLEGVYQKYLRTGNLVERLSSVLSDLITKRFVCFLLFNNSLNSAFLDCLKFKMNSNDLSLPLANSSDNCHVHPLPTLAAKFRPSCTRSLVTSSDTLKVSLTTITRHSGLVSGSSKPFVLLRTASGGRFAQQLQTLSHSKEALAARSISLDQSFYGLKKVTKVRRAMTRRKEIQSQTWQSRLTMGRLMQLGGRGRNRLARSSTLMMSSIVLIGWFTL